MAVNLSPVQLRNGHLLSVGRRRAAPGRARAGTAGAGDHRDRPDGELERELGRLPRDSTTQGSSCASSRPAASGWRSTISAIGYSSLAYLKYLPVQTIKIDRSFVQGIGADPAAEALLRAIVALGRSLGKRLVAEGVENDRQLAFVRELGCDKAQGFHIARPRPAAEIERLLAPPASRSAAGTRPRAGATAAPPPPGPSGRAACRTAPAAARAGLTQNSARAGTAWLL